jgi:hypothetical protein
VGMCEARAHQGRRVLHKRAYARLQSTPTAYILWHLWGMRRVLVLMVLEHLHSQVAEQLSTRQNYEGRLRIPPHTHTGVAGFVGLTQNQCRVAAGSADQEGWFW